jgi:Flp pilus assembly protein TadG
MIAARLRRREPAQVIVLFAISLIAMLGMVGVALDGGTLYLQRRTAQNAADAAALAGARALQQATVNPNTTIASEVCKYLQANAFGVTPTATASFVGITGNVLQAISLPTNCVGVAANMIPNSIGGVRVDATIGPYNTYLAGIVGIRQLQAQATATAQVGGLGIAAPNITPLAGCGPDMLRDAQHPDPHTNILMPDGITINPVYYGQDYILQGSQTAQDSNSSCPAWNGGSSAWKGRIDPTGIALLTPPFTVPIDNGNTNIDAQIVQMCISLYGPTLGDPTGTTASSSICYLLVPIAAPPNPSNSANIVTLGCFKLYDGQGIQKWRGILVAISQATCAYGVYTPTWTWGNNNNQTQVLLTT